MMSRIFNKNNKIRKKETIFLLVLRFAKRNKRITGHHILCVLCAFICAFDIYKFSPVILFKNKLNEFTIPLKYLANRLIDTPKLISEYMDIKKENRKLRRKLDILKINIVNMKNREQELKDLQQSVDLKYPISNSKSIEKVLGFDAAFYESFLIISATQKKSKPGNIVTSSDGLIGVIFDKNETKARVMTITNHRIFIPVISKTGERMIISGYKGNMLKSVEIYEKSFANIEIAIGDILYTSGEGGVFPMNIPVAKVSKIDTINHVIFAVPVLDLSSSSFVWVIEPVLNAK
ncbi:MAG: rod shape-determining protein MreC [Holosporales bacterium]|jgi:rod shape-determining protein MreC|nr:rod shape-determining protein MreC [Holosporales bacterium]